MNIVESKWSVLVPLFFIGIGIVLGFLLIYPMIGEMPDKSECYSVYGYVEDIDFVGTGFGSTIITFSDGRLFKLDGVITDIPQYHTVTIYYYKGRDPLNLRITSKNTLAYVEAR
jgi:hypothetical protein